MKLKLAQVCVSVQSEHWKRFAGIAATRGLGVSAYLRFLVANVLWDEARKDGMVSGPGGMTRSTWLQRAIDGKPILPAKFRRRTAAIDKV
jgi:hypothetical protein